MPLHGEYKPGTSASSRKQTELYEASGGAQGGMLEPLDEAEPGSR